MRLTKVIIPSVVGFGLLMVGSYDAHAKPAYAKAEKTACTTCHVSNKSKELNETGKVYKETKKLPEKK